MLNKWYNLKQHFMLVLAGLCTTTALAQPCTQLLIASYTPGNVCTGRTLSLSANTISGASYSWTGPASFSSATQNPSIPSMTTSRAGAYIVTATAGSCIYKDTVNVVVNTTPAKPTLTANNPPCKGGNLALGISGPGGTTFALYNPSGALMPSQTILNLNSSHNGTYKAVATSIANGCKSDTAYYTVTAIDLPAPTLLADTPICRGDTLHMFVMNNTPFVDNYYWNTPNSSPFYTSPTPLHLPNVNIGGFYTVQTVFDGCFSPIAYSLITFKPSVYASATITADGQIQSGYTELTFTTHITNGGNSPKLQWFKNGAPISGATDTVYTGILFTDIFPMDWFYAQVQRDSACGGISYTDTISVNKVLSIQNTSDVKALSPYPNPNTGTFTLQVPALNGIASMEIINAIGQSAMTKVIDHAGDLTITLPAGLANGLYTLRLINGDQTYVTRFRIEN